MTGSPILHFGILFLSVLLCGGLLFAVKWTDKRAAGKRYLPLTTAVVVLWLGATGLAAGAGVLNFDSTPPTMFLMLTISFVLTVWAAFSTLGTRLATTIPLWVLVGFQSFRIGVEVWLHRGYAEGLFPVQMTYSGLNFDIISGITAAMVAILLWTGKAKTNLVRFWNFLGLGLLITIVVIAILSAPVPFRLFHDEPANVWVTRFPGIWLPAILVQAALLGHLLVFRHLHLSDRHTRP